jgi:hypothetical protein
MSFAWFGAAIKTPDFIATVQIETASVPPRPRSFMGPTMHLIVECAILFLFIQSASASAAEDLKVYAGPLFGNDLAFPSTPELIGYANQTRCLSLRGRRRFQPS